jgi:hypothetical protein
VLAFARALGEFGATLMLAGNIPGKTTTVPLAIYTAVQTGEMGEAVVLVLALTTLSCLVLILAGRLGASRDREASLLGRDQKQLPGFALDVSWTAGDGVAVLFGPSGAGKTSHCSASRA